MARQRIDAEWDRIIAGRNENCLAHDADCNQELVEHWLREGQSPKGCSLHPGCHNHPENPTWRCKLYLAGQQRIIGVGYCDQMATLYDAARVFFAKYRTAKDTFGDLAFNTKADIAQRDIDSNLFLRAYLETIEHVLLKREELFTPEHRELRQKDARHNKYTTAGQLRHTQDLIFGQLENLTLGLEQLIKQNAAIEKRIGELANRQIVTLPYQPYQPLPETQPGVGWPVPPPVTCATPATFPELYEAAAKIRADYLSSPVADAANKSPWVDLLTTDKPVVS